VRGRQTFEGHRRPVPFTMSRGEFLARLNERAVKHYRIPVVTDDVLDDWLEAKIMPSPLPNGRQRLWTKHHYRHGLEILKLKSQGIKALAEIRWHLWIMGRDVPIFSARFSSRKSLQREFRRYMIELFKPINSKYQPIKKETKNDTWRANILIHKMGNLDPELQKTVTYDRGELLDLYSIARFGNTFGKANGAVGRIMATLLKRFDKFDTPTDSEQKSALKMLTQFAGNPHEEGSPAEESIAAASEDDFRLARKAFQILSNASWLFGPKARRSLATPRWRIGLFVWLLHVAHHGGGTIMGASSDEFDKGLAYIRKFISIETDI